MQQDGARGVQCIPWQHHADVAVSAAACGPGRRPRAAAGPFFGARHAPARRGRHRTASTRATEHRHAMAWQRRPWAWRRRRSTACHDPWSECLVREDHAVFNGYIRLSYHVRADWQRFGPRRRHHSTSSRDQNQPGCPDQEWWLRPALASRHPRMRPLLHRSR